MTIRMAQSERAPPIAVPYDSRYLIVRFTGYLAKSSQLRKDDIFDLIYIN